MSGTSIRCQAKHLWAAPVTGTAHPRHLSSLIWLARADAHPLRSERRHWSSASATSKKQAEAEKIKSHEDDFYSNKKDDPHLFTGNLGMGRVQIEGLFDLEDKTQVVNVVISFDHNDNTSEVINIR